MNRNYYCKVNSQEERDEILIKLSNLGEPADINSFIFTGVDGWYYIGFPSGESNWRLTPKDHIQNELAIEVPASELIDYITGKKVDEDALLEEAKRRYPIGTKFKSVNNKEIYKVETNSHRWCGKGIDVEEVPWVYLQGNWAEIIEEPKVETKFEKDKWYELKYLFNGKPCNTLAKSTNDSINEFRFEKYYDLEDKEWRTAVGFSIDPEIEIIYIKELLLQEIQQYLPADHPDKFTTSIVKEEFVLPEYWFLRFKTKEVFNELCKKYAPDFIFFENAGICNNPTKLKLGNYHYLTKDTKYGEEITFEQFKKYVLKEEVKEEVKSNIIWKIGDYVVFVEDWGCSKKGDIDKIKKLGAGVIALYLEKEELVGSPLHKECKLKVFPTLQEAQKFSDELLGKSKTSLGVEDLVKGAIYCSLMSDKPQWESLHLYHGNGENMFKYRLYIHSSYKGNDKFDKSDWGKCTSNQYRLATSLEKKWLKTCIKQDKFIPQDQLDKYDDEGNLMESKEYPEYYECVNIPDTNKNWIEGKIYKIRNSKQLESYENFIDETGEPNGFCPYNHKRFKPSTKEAYEAQFKKDEEFKVGDWIVIEDSCKLENGCIGCPEGIFKIIKDTKEHIHGLVRSNNTYLIQTSNAVWRISNQGVRKAIPHEIPVENSTIITGDYDAGNLVNLLKSLSTLDYNPIYKWQLEGEESKKKIPDLIDKSKVEVKIKRTKVKQIKL